MEASEAFNAHVLQNLRRGRFLLAELGDGLEEALVKLSLPSQPRGTLWNRLDTEELPLLLLLGLH